MLAKNSHLLLVVVSLATAACSSERAVGGKGVGRDGGATAAGDAQPRAGSGADAAMGAGGAKAGAAGGASVARDGGGAAGASGAAGSAAKDGGLSTGIIPDDRKVTWSPGIPGGIPTRAKLCATVTDAAYGAKGDGTADDSAAIQAALDACPMGQVVYVPAGTYRLVHGLAIPSGVVLRGAGPGMTRLEGDKLTEKAIVQAGSYDESNSPKTAIMNGYDRRSTRLEVASAAAFVAGDFVIIDQQNDDDLVRLTGEGADPSESPCTWGSRDSGTRLLGQLVEIKGVDKATNTVDFDPPLAMTLGASLAPEMYRVRAKMTRDVGIEDLTVADRSYRGDNNANIRFWGVAYSWIRNVESADVSGRHIQLTEVFRCEVRDSYVHHAHDYDPGANAYGISVETQTSETLVENDIVYWLNAGLMLDSAGPGNVIAYNFTDHMYGRNYPDASWLMADLVANHCAHPFMSLYEGNEGSQISSDNIHGSSSHQTFFRNYVDRQHGDLVATGNLGDIVLAANNRFMNVVGNVLGRPGDDTIKGAVYEQDTGNCLETVAVFKLGYPSNCAIDTLIDPQVKATLIRHGNFDYVGNAVVWDPAIAERTLPASLYLANKPTWWGASPWPAIGPDVAGYVHDIPAKTRFDQLPNK